MRSCNCSLQRSTCALSLRQQVRIPGVNTSRSALVSYLRKVDMYVYQKERRERDDGQDDGDQTACFSTHKSTAMNYGFRHRATRKRSDFQPGHQYAQCRELLGDTIRPHRSLVWHSSQLGLYIAPHLQPRVSSIRAIGL